MDTKQILDGAVAIAELWGPNAKPVAREIAQKRADICARCPLNRPAKGWLDTISKAAAKATRTYFRIKDEAHVSVDGEEKLGICDACNCCLKLKVHVDINHIMDTASDEMMAKFHDKCWITHEVL